MPWALAMGGLGIAIPQTTIFVGNHLAGAAYAAIFTPTVGFRTRPPPHPRGSWLLLGLCPGRRLELPPCCWRRLRCGCRPLSAPVAAGATGRAPRVQGLGKRPWGAAN